MTILLIAAAWILIVLLATGLCMVARGGDEQLGRQAALTPLTERPPWESFDPRRPVAARVQVRDRARAPREREPSHRRRDVGVAA
jgi:hypothetical protein